MSPVEMADCVGLWRRALLVDADGSRDTDSDVRWLQGHSAFVDLRRPSPSSPNAVQDGFAGWLRQDGEVFEWARVTGLHPPGPHPDAGRMSWAGGILVESGVHSDYVEHWVRDAAVEGPCWALDLVAADSTALLLRVGALFGWAARTGAATEISLGELIDGRWVITDSSDPSRAGVELVPVLCDSGLRLVSGDGQVTDWTIGSAEGAVEL